jgi:hypoxanthine phosphoribosyltransferase
MKLKLILPERKIQKKVASLARQIRRDFPQGELLLIGILKGAFIFLADLARHLSRPVEIDFVRLASYGAGQHTSGKIRLQKDLETPIKGKHVLIVEDIVDTGITLRYLCSRLRARKPRSLKIVTLLDKPSRRRVDLTPDYVGFKIPDQFVVGYGLDWAEAYRHLRGIYALQSAGDSN